MITNLVSYIVNSLVANKDSVKILSKKQKDEILITVSVDVEDKGKIVGKDGAVIKSIRTIINAISSQKVKVVIGEN